MKPILTVIACVLLVAGCGGASTGSGGSAPAARDDRGIPQGVAAPGSGSGNNAERRPGDTGGAATPPVRPANLPAARSMVYTADLRVSAKDVTAAATRAKQLTTAAGGYVGSEDEESSPGSPATASLTLKIPSSRYPNVLNQLGSQLGRRMSLQQKADDVTQDVADVASRVKSAQAALASFRTLLDKANTVGEVIQVEQEISTREADLESLQARQKALDQQTSYATVNLRLDGPAAAAPKKRKDKGGFVGGVTSGWNAFTAFLGGLAMVFGAVLPFLALLAVLAIAAWYARRPAGVLIRRVRTTKDNGKTAA